jgi:LysM repeat protein
MFKNGIYIVVFMFVTSVFGQNYTKHKVAKGETITQIAQKYKVTPYDIYKLNPDSQNGIQPDVVLLIPKSIEKEVKKEEVKTVQNSVPKGAFVKIHEVQLKETLYSISKQYKVSIEELEEENPFLKTDGLKPGQKLEIPSEFKFVQNKLKFKISHEVVTGDTKYSIAKKYGISVEELEKQNPEIKDNLPLGFQLKISKVTTNSTPNEEVKPKAKPINLLEYTVKSGETLYSLTRLFKLSEGALIGLNPDLKEGVKEGMVLKVPANLSFSKETKSPIKDLSKSISSQNQKELVLFLPFNASKIQNDSVTSVSERLKKDKFLNMTLDFYSGALMAIDSARVLGLNMNIKIYDSQETKNSTSALDIISNNDFSKTDAVIGPFYQINVEKVASVLENRNIAVISPLSKDDGKSYKNLYQSMPDTDAIKGAMFDFMRSKNGNIIAIIDPKKASIKEYIQDFQKDVKIVGLSEKGGFVADSIKKFFVKDKINYVVMASEKTGTIFTTTNAMSSSLKEYQMQLVILEQNETLDFEEIALSRLTKLKMAYPSITKDNDTDEAQKFERAYKKKNKVIPNQYAVRGFDITFDTMLRLAQDKPFEETIDVASEQVESKFDYEKKISGGYANNGIYILYYDEDLIIKQAE